MTKKTTQPKQSATEQTSNSSEALIDKYGKKILIGVVVIILLSGGIYGYNHFSKSRNEKAAEAMFKCEQYFAADNYEKALNGDGQGCTGLLKIIDEYGSTETGNLAKLYAGMSYAQMGKYEEAVNYLEKFSACDDAMVSPAAIGMLGNCYAQLNQLDKATETLLKAAKKADNNSLSPIYLIQAGEIFESQGQSDKALDCYKQIKEKYIQSMQYSDIDKYIERVTK